ncbi:MAG: stage II sporulation protein M [Bacteroidota bacterium]
MKEAFFVRQNKDKWQNYEKIGKNQLSITPDELANTYIDITTDLSYAQSKYRDSKLAQYLNGLSSTLHHAIYKNKREKSKRFISYWLEEVPLEMFKARNAMFISLIVFAISIVIGCFSTSVDDTFVRFILGDDYVEMTLRNIANNDPMGVYKSQSSEFMFLVITLNNLKVAFFAFALGIFTSFGSSYILISNGVMLGVFQYFFYQKGLLADSMLSIWIHGTLEISAIVIAGGAGIHMGNGWLFPGTYSRMASFKKSSKTGLKIVIGLVPVIITAGFLESYITRHSEFSPIAKASFILVSLIIVILYFIYLPLKIKKDESKFNPNRVLQTT